MNRHERRRQQRAVRNEAQVTDPEHRQIAAGPPVDSADDCARPYYRDDGGES
jgi:hypothetical protein